MRYGSGYAFISYVGEDHRRVLNLKKALENRGVQVWMNREQIGPGELFKEELRKAIEKGAFFLACFSSRYLNRRSHYQNEELALAVEQLRLRGDQKWFIPVLLERAQISTFDREVYPGRRLSDYQFISLFKNRSAALDQLSKAMSPISLAGHFDQFLATMSREEFRAAAEILMDVERSIDAASTFEKLALPYNQACVSSRLARTLQSQDQIDDELGKGLRHLERFLVFGNGGAWSELGRKVANEVARIFYDDDLYFLVTKCYDRIVLLIKDLGGDVPPIPQNPSGRGGCVVLGTRILTAGGYLPVEDLRVGDSVVCVEKDPDRQVMGSITSIHTSFASRLTRLSERLYCTPAQRAMRADGTWVRADGLENGSCLASPESGAKTLANVASIDGCSEIYSIEVDHPAHNFVAEDYVLHNFK